MSALTIAAALGVLALLPFAVGVYLAYTGWSRDAEHALARLLPYMATIVSFIGGVQWGRMLAAGRASITDMALAVVPALIAWGALLLGAPWQTLLLLSALLFAWLLDEHGVRRGWQGRGFLRLRRLLTLGVAVSVILIGWRVLRA